MMAERRMFTRKIIENDAFIDLPATARLLYYDLGMRADDDGFVNSPKAIVRQTGASMGDLNALISCGLVIGFENGLVVITHWKLHNYIQKDRYKPTLYEREKQMLKLGENNAYLLDLSKTDTECIQSVSVGKVRDSLELDNISYSKEYSCSPDGERETKTQSKKAELAQLEADFKTIYSIYPRKRGKQAAFKTYKAFVTNGKQINGHNVRLANTQLWEAVNQFAKEVQVSGRDLEHVPYFSTFLNSQVLDYVPEQAESEAG